MQPSADRVAVVIGSVATCWQEPMSRSPAATCGNSETRYHLTNLIVNCAYTVQTELQKKTQEIKSASATNFRKQSPSGTSPAYIGLNFTREHAVTSVLTRLLPIPKTCIRTFADVLDTGEDVVVIISEFRAAYVLVRLH